MAGKILWQSIFRLATWHQRVFFNHSQELQRSNRQTNPNDRTNNATHVYKDFRVMFVHRMKTFSITRLQLAELDWQNFKTSRSSLINTPFYTNRNQTALLHKIILSTQIGTLYNQYARSDHMHITTTTTVSAGKARLGYDPKTGAGNVRQRFSVTILYFNKLIFFTIIYFFLIIISSKPTQPKVCTVT